MAVRLGLLVKQNDVLRDVCFAVCFFLFFVVIRRATAVSFRAPVERLQKVRRHDVRVAVAAHAREENNLLRVARLQKRLHSLRALASLGVQLTAQRVVALPLTQTRDVKQRGFFARRAERSVFRVFFVFGADERVRHLLVHGDVLLEREPKCGVAVAGAYLQKHGVLEAAALGEPRRAPTQEARPLG